jgi:hypothetical protein
MSLTAGLLAANLALLVWVDLLLPRLAALGSTTPIGSAVRHASRIARQGLRVALIAVLILAAGASEAPLFLELLRRHVYFALLD